MNNDLISLEAALNHIKSVFCQGCNNYDGIRCRACEVDDVMGVLDGVPIVDGEPVRHGWWIPKTHIDGEVTHECSYCGEEAIYYDNHQGGITSEPTDYCPYCGTKMDLGDIG